MLLPRLLFIKYKGGFWVYPVFDALDGVGIAVFLTVLILPGPLFLIVGQKLHYIVWGKDI